MTYPTYDQRRSEPTGGVPPPAAATHSSTTSGHSPSTSTEPIMIPKSNGNGSRSEAVVPPRSAGSHAPSVAQEHEVGVASASGSGSGQAQQQGQQQKKKSGGSSDPYYGHEEMSRMSARFIISLFNCPDRPPATTPATPQPTMAHFIAYSLHRTRLPHFVTLVALLLLHRLKTRFPAARGSSGHRLFISAFMIASKVVCDDTYSNASWCVVGQKMFTLREVNQMEREMCGYLEWNLNAGEEEVHAFERGMVAEHSTEAVRARRMADAVALAAAQQQEQQQQQQQQQYTLPATAAGTPASTSASSPAESSSVVIPTSHAQQQQQQQQRRPYQHSASYPATSSHVDVEAQAQAYALARYQAQQQREREIAVLPHRRPRPERAMTNLQVAATLEEAYQYEGMDRDRVHRRRSQPHQISSSSTMSSGSGPTWVSTGGGYLAPPTSSSSSSLDGSQPRVFHHVEESHRSKPSAPSSSWEQTDPDAYARYVAAGFDGRLSSVDDVGRQHIGSTNSHWYDGGVVRGGTTRLEHDHSPHPELIASNSNNSSNQSSPESIPCQTPSPGFAEEEIHGSSQRSHLHAAGPVAIPGATPMGTAGLAGSVHSTSIGIASHHHHRQSAVDEEEGAHSHDGTVEHHHEHANVYAAHRPNKLARRNTSASYPVVRMQVDW